MAFSFGLSGSGILTALKTQAVTPTQLFYSSMEAPTFGPSYWSEWDTDAWSQSSNDKHCDSKSAVVKVDTGSVPDNITTVNINTSGYQSIYLNFWYRIPEQLESGDWVEALWSIGSGWNAIHTFSNIKVDDWTYASFLLPSGAENKSNLKIRFSANLDKHSTDKDEFRLDCVELTGVSIPPPECTNDSGCSTDEWIDTQNLRWISTGECTEKEQKEQQYKDYYCAQDLTCQYNLTILQWVDTGTTRNKLDQTVCDDSNTCTQNDSCSAGTCAGTPIR